MELNLLRKYPVCVCTCVHVCTYVHVCPSKLHPVIWFSEQDPVVLLDLWNNWKNVQILCKGKNLHLKDLKVGVGLKWKPLKSEKICQQTSAG